MHVTSIKLSKSKLQDTAIKSEVVLNRIGRGHLKCLIRLMVSKKWLMMRRLGMMMVVVRIIFNNDDNNHNDNNKNNDKNVKVIEV